MDRMKLEEIIERNLGSPTINIPNINGASSQSPDERLPIREFIEVISDVDSPQLRIQSQGKAKVNFLVKTNSSEHKLFQSSVDNKYDFKRLKTIEHLQR